MFLKAEPRETLTFERSMSDLLLPVQPELISSKRTLHCCPLGDLVESKLFVKCLVYSQEGFLLGKKISAKLQFNWMLHSNVLIMLTGCTSLWR